MIYMPLSPSLSPSQGLCVLCHAVEHAYFLWHLNSWQIGSCTQHCAHTHTYTVRTTVIRIAKRYNLQFNGRRALTQPSYQEEVKVSCGNACHRVCFTPQGLCDVKNVHVFSQQPCVVHCLLVNSPKFNLSLSLSLSLRFLRVVMREREGECVCVRAGMWELAS